MPLGKPLLYLPFGNLTLTPPSVEMNYGVRNLLPTSSQQWWQQRLREPMPHHLLIRPVCSCPDIALGGRQFAAASIRRRPFKCFYKALLMVPSQVLTFASCDSAGEIHFVVTVLIWV